MLGIFSKNKKKYATVSVSKTSKSIESKGAGAGSGLWEKCPSCHEILYKIDVKGNLKKCTNCDHYFGMTALERVDLLIDAGTFVELDKDLTSGNPLEFPGYGDKYIKTAEKTGMNEGVISGTGDMNGIKVSFAAMEFSFLGGSMGSVVGEKLTRAIERGVEENLPVVIVATSGGARMHEGILSLMQMAKTSAALEKLREKGMPFISVPVNPTTGGVTASFAMLGDIIITEPNALIGFAGPRVIEQTIKQKLPEGFQKSEFLLECGMVDVIAKREEMKDTISTLLGNLL
ncbi:acetyl-coenzyme A carboxylase carboxyl transferase subunit beta [Propionigenium maris DSM 9537]|uniref:Acetyl-coenzyme A carboxylase carboxyl transferase subunit beta n=1 Tax=Propionigenium maris DSM 9537 TaxID=1123000 RepID=A0A9W6LME7_9FUSO|nr:acetyl-coenzyme A carboxylase carboxyl transferase subunit beta [Propionigenium maris DSM 9537]